MKEQKVVLVTGALGNLGKAVMEKFIKEGNIVVGTQSANHSNTDSKNNAGIIAVDLTNESAAAEAIESTIKKYNRIDVAVLTVGGFAMGSIAKTTTSDVLDQYKINFETAYNIARPVFIQMMKQESGNIFLIGSKPGLNSKNSKGLIAYSLSKSLLFRLAELMNNEAKGKHVVTSVVVPSTIDTPQNRKAMPGVDFSKWQKPEAIADLIFKHAIERSDVNSYVIEV